MASKKRCAQFIARDDKENALLPRPKRESTFRVFCDDTSGRTTSTSFASSQLTNSNTNSQLTQPLVTEGVKRQPFASLQQNKPQASSSSASSSDQSLVADDFYLQALHALPTKREPFEDIGQACDDSQNLINTSGSPMVIERSDGEEEDEEEASSSVYQSVLDAESDYCTAPPVTEKERHADLIFCQPEYADDIYRYMRCREERLRPKCSYMRKQKDINEEMRTILVDWLIDVTVEYDLQMETLHLAVDVIDRMLSQMDCPRLKLQLIGSTAMMIAAKFEEIYPPELKDFVYITDDTYTSKQVLRMERLILQTLIYEVAAPTSFWFASRFLKICRSALKTSQLAYYLLELALLDYGFLKYRRSQIAASAVCLANVITGPTPWPYCVELATGISLAEMYPCLQALLKCFKNASLVEQKAAYEKYSSSKHLEVALLDAPEALPEIW
uniref:Cyclin N-terminal domain-containing protein n=1 Tax=Plectus sambesii TaxID=2011161 RepID=A0A914W2M8_9BILA